MHFLLKAKSLLMTKQLVNAGRLTSCTSLVGPLLYHHFRNQGEDVLRVAQFVSALWHHGLDTCAHSVCVAVLRVGLFKIDQFAQCNLFAVLKKLATFFVFLSRMSLEDARNTIWHLVVRSGNVKVLRTRP